MNTGRFITTALAASILAIPAMADAPGYFKVPGTDTTLKIYGNVQVQGTFDIKGNYGVGAGLSPNEELADNAKLKNQWSWRARTTWGFDTLTASPLGDVKTKVEFRATNDGGSANLRHCYGSIGNLLIGNTDSIFADWDASPNYIDTDGMLGDFYGNGRVLQVRYTVPAGPVTAQFAIEKDKTERTGTASSNHYFPGAFAAAVNFGGDWGHVRGSVAYSRYSEKAILANGTPLARTDSRSKSALNLGLGANVVLGKGNLTAQLFHGVGFYGVGYLDSFYNSDDLFSEALKVQKAMGWTVGYSHDITDSITVAGGVGQAIWKRNRNVSVTALPFDGSDPADGDYVDAEDLTVSDAASNYHKFTVTNYFANLQWKATKTTTFAVEYFHSDCKVSGSDFSNDYFMKKDGTFTSKNKEDRINMQVTYKFF